VSEDARPFRRHGPVRWFDPPELARDLVAEIRAHRSAATNDSRERRAAADAGAPIETLDLSERDEVCFDHVADTGDGFGATYSVAWLVAQPDLAVTGPNGNTQRLPPSDLLVCGGDQVYAHPFGTQYDDRFVGPWGAARPAGPGGPDRHLLAVPGDHDWWDGLDSFGRVFCGARSIGGWRTVQRRTYFSVRLPSRWWLWGIDPGLSGRLDGPQVDYFEAMADRAVALSGDEEARLVVVVPAPGWLDAGGRAAEPASDQAGDAAALDAIDAIVRRRPGLRLVALVAGDKHYYARHQPRGAGPVLFVDGRGGGFAFPTDRIPAAVTLAREPAAEDAIRAHLACVYPTADASRRCRRRVLFAGRRQGSFAALPALAYLAWLLPRRARPLTVAGLVAAAAALVRGRPLQERLAWGTPHALAHVLMMAAADGLAGGSAAPRSRRAMLLAATGAVMGPLVIGAYLFNAGRVAGINDNETFSAIAEQGYKGFLRFHLDRTGVLRAYAVAVDRTVPNDDWEPAGTAASDAGQPDATQPGAPRFRIRPGARGLEPRLVDDVVELA
jgi:hypothetical protein